MNTADAEAATDIIRFGAGEVIPWELVWGHLGPEITRALMIVTILPHSLGISILGSLVVGVMILIHH